MNDRWCPAVNLHDYSRGSGPSGSHALYKPFQHASVSLQSAYLDRNYRRRGLLDFGKTVEQLLGADAIVGAQRATQVVMVKTVHIVASIDNNKWVVNMLCHTQRKSGSVAIEFNITRAVPLVKPASGLVTDGAARWQTTPVCEP